MMEWYTLEFGIDDEPPHDRWSISSRDRINAVKGIAEALSLTLRPQSGGWRVVVINDDETVVRRDGSDASETGDSVRPCGARVARSVTYPRGLECMLADGHEELHIDKKSGLCFDDYGPRYVGTAEVERKED